VSLHVFYDIPGTGVQDVTRFIRRDTLALNEKAEEGATGMAEITFDDPDMILDFNGHRRIWIIEDEDTTGDPLFFYGFTYNQTIKRGPDILGRIWIVEVSDANALWLRRIVTGPDSKRPDETDVARIQWLLGTNEATGFGDVTTYVSLATTGSMDENDYRGTVFGEIAEDCSLVKGKNYFAFAIGNPPVVYAWYGRDTLATYESPFTITNDPTLLLPIGTTYWAGDQEASLRRDVERIYWACYLPFDGGAVYQTRAATAANYAKRDFAAPSVTVKRKARAAARAQRMLDDVDSPDLRLRVTVVKVPPASVNGFKAGMRIQVLMTEMEEAATLAWWRIVDRTCRQTGDGTYYDVELELVKGPDATAATCSTSLAGSIVDSIDEQAYVAPGVMTLAITPDAGDACLIFGGLMSMNSNVPTDEDIVATGSNTLIYEANSTSGHPVAGMTYQAQASPSGSYNVSGTFTPGFGASNNSFWAVVAAAIKTAETAPVQTGPGATGSGVVTDTFPGAVTPGNMIVMMVAARANGDYPTYSPTTGWTTLATGSTTHFSDADTIVIAARCVQSGDGTTYGGGVAGGGNKSVVAIAELAIT